MLCDVDRPSRSCACFRSSSALGVDAVVGSLFEGNLRGRGRMEVTGCASDAAGAGTAADGLFEVFRSSDIGNAKI